jgi:hypothetical protein
LAKLAKDKSGKNGEAEAAISGDISKMKELLFAVKDKRAQPVWVKVGISSDTHMEIAGDGLAEGMELVCGPFKTLNRTLKPNELVERKSAEKKSGDET